MSCYASVITSSSRGALAVLRVWGPRSVEVVGAVWRPRRGAGFEVSEVGRPRLGLIGAGLGDEVVATLISRAPPRVELHGHGGSAALTLVLDALVAAGATVRPPSDWVRDEAGSALEAAALVELARAPTARVAEFLLDQSLGALRRALEETAELCAGGPDELAAVRARLTRLIAVGRVGARMVAGARAAIVGRPNVGKSSLLNALVGYERAIVDQAAGTTRDVVSARAALDGLPVEFVDTAGLRAARDDVEAAGVAAARGIRAVVDVVILVFDRSRPLASEDERLLAGRDDRTILVANKSDLPDAGRLASRGPMIEVSAARGDGVDDLRAAIAARIAPHPPQPGEAAPFLPEHLAAIEAALELLHSDRPDAARARLLALLG